MISNCVINLALDKPVVFQEVARVLKPGGGWPSATYSPLAGGLPVVPETGCCGPTPTPDADLHAWLYDVNDFAASVRVFAVKP